MRWLSNCAVGLLLSSSSFAEEARGPRWEVTVLPLAGGNSDVGFGGGYILSAARIEDQYRPYSFSESPLLSHHF